MLGGIGLPELIVIFLVFLLLFGAKALPEVARGLAQAINIFKREAGDMKRSIEDGSQASDTVQENSFNEPPDTDQTQ